MKFCIPSSPRYSPSIDSNLEKVGRFPPSSSQQGCITYKYRYTELIIKDENGGGTWNYVWTAPFRLKKKICVNNWNQGNKIYLTLNCEEVHEWNNEKRQYV